MGREGGKQTDHLKHSEEECDAIARRTYEILPSMHYLASNAEASNERDTDNGVAPK